MSEETEVDETHAEPEPDEKVEPATLEALLGKGRASRVVTIIVDGRRRLLRFEAIPADQFDELERQHKPEPADVGRFLWNPRTFPPALVAASLVEPVLPESDVRRIWASPAWSKGDRAMLFSAAYEVNTTSQDLVDMGKGFGLIP